MGERWASVAYIRRECTSRLRSVFSKGMAEAVTVRLASGLVIDDATTKLRAKFKQWPWERYDGCFRANPKRVTVGDIDRVYQLGARAARAAYRELIRKHRRELNALLAQIPQKALENANLDAARGPVVKLFDLVMSQPGIKLANGTKFLYPFRPRFLAVIDSIVENYYWYATPVRNEQRFRQLQATKRGGAYVFELLRLLQEDVRSCRHEIDAVLKQCAAEPFAKAPRVRVVESLIWHYYAR